MCRCVERRAELVAAALAAADGDLSKIVPALTYNVRTLAEDAAAMSRAALAGARQRLGARR